MKRTAVATAATAAIAVASGFYAIGKPDSEGRVLIQVTPDGDFTPIDGREMDVPAWRMNPANAQRVIAAHAQRKTPLVVDYDHQTLYKEKNGQPALAAAWFEGFVYRPGEGLFATAKSTARASQAITADELKYFSPVFAYDKQGNVTQVLMGAFTNTPAIDGMAAVELAAAASSQFSNPAGSAGASTEIPAMEELLAKLRAALGLANDASADAVVSAITKLTADKTATDTQLAAASAQLSAAGKPDPSKFVPIDTFNALQTQVAALSQQQRSGAVDVLIEEGEKQHKLTAATSAWFKDFATKDLEGARTWLKDAPAIAALGAMQSGGERRQAAAAQQITDPAGVAVLARKYQDEQRAAGVEISTTAAVAHVTRKEA
jgi:phage I-like protein